MRTDSSAEPIPWPAALTCLTALVLLASNLVIYHSIADDAYISFRYLDNWLDGAGLVYNPGERVEGYTNPLWIVLLAPLRGLGTGPEPAALILSLVSLGLLLWGVVRMGAALGGTRSAGLAGTVLAASSVPLARWTMSGMETTCFAALLVLANQRLAATRRHGALSSLFFGLAVLVRPEGVLPAGVAFATALLWNRPTNRERMWRIGGPVLVFAAFPLARLIFSSSYYGHPLPNTFYAKLGGDLPALLPSGIAYVKSFLTHGGVVLVGLSVLAVRSALMRNWVLTSVLFQTLALFGYVAWVGGDSFEMHRFIVPAIPLLSVLGGVGLSRVIRARHPVDRWRLSSAVALAAVLQVAWVNVSPSRSAFRSTVVVRQEREIVADWLRANLAPDSRLAVNAAGLIPYRTGMRTIDMLGLNDLHIARSAAAAARWGGLTMVGHFKHDGDYVCRQAPDAVLTSGGALHRGRHSGEAIMQAALNTFPGDRELLNAPGCAGLYRPIVEELRPGRFMVVYLRSEGPAPAESAEKPVSSAEDWFRLGLRLMTEARLEEAVRAFESSLQLNPGHPAAMTNVGYCLFDLQQYDRAVRVFEEVLEENPGGYEALYGLAMTSEKLGRRDRAVELWRRYVSEAPDSVWKERARERLSLLVGGEP